MACLKKVVLAAFAACVLTCGSTHEPPAFNACWAIFPPGPMFEKQIATYVKSDDPNIVLASCLPTYKLDNATCQQFKHVGRGAWPPEVTSWCSEQYRIELDPL